MKIFRVDRNHPDQSLIDEGARLIRDGGLVAFPTETVYGLGADALNAGAVSRIFAAKGRPANNPLIVHVRDVDAAKRLVRSWPIEADRLASAFWPGPLTLVLAKREIVPDVVTAGLPTVALRVPDHPVALRLLEAADRPIAAPSANPFTMLSPTTGAHVVKGMGDRVDLLIDAGPARLGIESTVLDLTGPRPVLLRPGTIDADQLGALLGQAIEMPGAYEESSPRPSPGMLGRHYTPRARLVIVEASASGSMGARVEHAKNAGAKVGVLLFGSGDAGSADRKVAMPSDPAAYASSIYGALHDMDDAGVDLIIVESVPPGAAWAGVRDRLARAGGPA